MEAVHAVNPRGRGVGLATLESFVAPPMAPLELRYFSLECCPVPVRVRASAMWFMEAVLSRRWKLSMRSTRGGEARAPWWWWLRALLLLKKKAVRR